MSILEVSAVCYPSLPFGHFFSGTNTIHGKYYRNKIIYDQYIIS